MGFSAALSMTLESTGTHSLVYPRTLDAVYGGLSEYRSDDMVFLEVLCLIGRNSVYPCRVTRPYRKESLA